LKKFAFLGGKQTKNISNRKSADVIKRSKSKGHDLNQTEKSVAKGFGRLPESRFWQFSGSGNPVFQDLQISLTQGDLRLKEKSVKAKSLTLKS
jgi:hypothetical protein